MNLNQIEHGKLRKQFHDPRIHFAIVCASISCPRLLNQAYLPKKIDPQLDQMAKDFILDSRKNIVSEDQLKLSRIFQWYKGDFLDKEYPDLPAFLSQYSSMQIKKNANIDWMDYNWKLNGLKN